MAVYYPYGKVGGGPLQYIITCPTVSPSAEIPVPIPAATVWNRNEGTPDNIRPALTPEW